jgi:hypothetical protein
MITCYKIQIAYEHALVTAGYEAGHYHRRTSVMQWPKHECSLKSVKVLQENEEDVSTG